MDVITEPRKRAEEQSFAWLLLEIKLMEKEALCFVDDELSLSDVYLFVEWEDPQ